MLDERHLKISSPPSCVVYRFLKKKILLKLVILILVGNGNYSSIINISNSAAI